MWFQSQLGPHLYKILICNWEFIVLNVVYYVIDSNFVYKCLSWKDRFFYNRYINYELKYQDIQTMNNDMEGILDRQIGFWAACEIHDISWLRILIFLNKSMGFRTAYVNFQIPRNLWNASSWCVRNWLMVKFHFWLSPGTYPSAGHTVKSIWFPKNFHIEDSSFFTLLYLS